MGSAPAGSDPAYSHLSLFSRHFSLGGYRLELFVGPAFEVPRDVRELGGWASQESAENFAPNACWIGTMHVHRGQTMHWFGVGRFDAQDDLLTGALDYHKNAIVLQMFVGERADGRVAAQGSIALARGRGINLCNEDGCTNVTNPPHLIGGHVTADAALNTCFARMRAAARPAP